MGHWNLTQTLGIDNDDDTPPIVCGAQSASGSSTFSPAAHGDITYIQLDEDDSPVLQSTCSTGLTQRRPRPVGQFQVRLVKPIMPFLAMLYLRAQRIHHLARNVHVFHMQSIYLARQALHLVILLNDAVNVDEGPEDEQYDERNDLEDELIELYDAMTQWGSDRGEEFEYHQFVGEVEAQYARFFKERFYFHDTRDCSMDRLYQKFVAYDEKTIRYRQRHQIHVTSSTTVEIDCWTETLEEESESEGEAEEWLVEDAVSKSPLSPGQSGMGPRALAAELLSEDLHSTSYRTPSGRAPRSRLHPRNDHARRKHRAIAAVRIHLAVTHLQVVQIGARKHVKVSKSRWKCDKRCVKTPPATTAEQEAIPDMSVPLLGHSTLNEPSLPDPFLPTTKPLKQFLFIPLLESQDQIETQVDTNSPQSQQRGHPQVDLPGGEWRPSQMERNPILPIRSTRALGAGAARSPTYTTGFTPLPPDSWTRDWAPHYWSPQVPPFYYGSNSWSIPEQCFPTSQTLPITCSPDLYLTPANVPQNQGTPLLGLSDVFFSWTSPDEGPQFHTPLLSNRSTLLPLTMQHTEENERRINNLSLAERELVTTDGGTIESQLMVLHAIEQYPPDTYNNRVWNMVCIPGSKFQTEHHCKAVTHHGLKCCHKSATVLEARQHFVACHVNKLCWVCPIGACWTKWLQLHDLKRHLASLPNVDQPYSRVRRMDPTRNDHRLPATASSSTWSKAGYTSRRRRRSLAHHKPLPRVESSMKMHWDKEPEESAGHSTNEQEGHRQQAPMADEVLSWTSSDPRSSVIFNSNVGLNHPFVTESDNRNITTTAPWRASWQAREDELSGFEWDCDASLGSATWHNSGSGRGFPLFKPPILDVLAHSALRPRNDADVSGFNRTTPHTGSARYLAPELYPINTLSVQRPSTTDTGSDDLAMGHRNWSFQYLNGELSSRLDHARDHIRDHLPMGVRVEWSPDGNTIAGYNDTMLSCERDEDGSPHGIAAKTWYRKPFSCGRRYQPYPTRTRRTRPQSAPLSFLCSP